MAPDRIKSKCRGVVDCDVRSKTSHEARRVSREIHAHVANAPRPLRGGVSAVHGNRRTAAQGGETVARYHVPGSVVGWHVLETDDMTALAEHVNNWGDLIDIELNPVVEDAQAAEAAARVFGK